jgi:hypothetical protein
MTIHHYQETPAMSSDKNKTSEHLKHVRVHIDQKPYESPSPTTGEALYRLGHVKAGLNLYREVQGNREDQPIPDSSEEIHLHEDEHFHSGPPKTITIIVSGTPHEWSKPRIDYVEVVTLFDPAYPQHPDWTYSVTYKHGPSENPDGILTIGHSVKVKDRMVFHVKCTGQS